MHRIVRWNARRSRGELKSSQNQYHDKLSPIVKCLQPLGLTSATMIFIDNSRITYEGGLTVVPICLIDTEHLFHLPASNRLSRIIKNKALANLPQSRTVMIRCFALTPEHIVNLRDNVNIEWNGWTLASELKLPPFTSSVFETLHYRLLASDYFSQI